MTEVTWAAPDAAAPEPTLMPPRKSWKRRPMVWILGGLGVSILAAQITAWTAPATESEREVRPGWTATDLRTTRAALSRSMDLPADDPFVDCVFEYMTENATAEEIRVGVSDRSKLEALGLDAGVSCSEVIR